MIALAILISAILWGFFIQSALSSRKVRIAASEEFMVALAHAIEVYCANTFKTAEIFQTSADIWLQSNKTQDPRTSHEFVSLIGNFRKQTDNLVDIRIADTQGNLFYFDKPSTHSRDNVSDREYFKAVIDAPPGTRHIGIPVVSRVSGEWRLPVTMRAAEQRNGLEIINASVSLSRMLEAFEAERPKPNGSIGLWNIDGTLLARAPRVDDLFGKKVASDPVDLERFRQSGVGTFLSKQSPIGSIPRLVAHARIAGTPVVVIVSIPMSDILAPWYRESLLAFLLLLVATLAVLVYAIRVANISRIRDSHEAELERLSTLDPLTNVYNRRYFFTVANSEFERFLRYGGPLSVAMLDVDHFKHVNDTWGHQAGDQMLKLLGETLMANVRTTDTIARLGGEEFAIVLPQTDLAGASIILERIRSSVEKLSSIQANTAETVRFTVSIGITEASALDGTFDMCLSRADALLYEAKNNGRNCLSIGLHPAER